jgi:hypothetical protein
MEGPRTFPLNRSSAPLGIDNAVLRARGRVHTVRDFAGPLSIKTVTSGTVAWRVDNRDLVVTADSFLVLLDGEPYSMDIQTRTPVETFCVFFQRGFVESVHASVARADLEPAELAFPGRLHSRDDRRSTRSMSSWPMTCSCSTGKSAGASA